MTIQTEWWGKSIFNFNNLTCHLIMATELLSNVRLWLWRVMTKTQTIQHLIFENSNLLSPTPLFLWSSVLLWFSAQIVFLWQRGPCEDKHKHQWSVWLKMWSESTYCPTSLHRNPHPCLSDVAVARELWARWPPESAPVCGCGTQSCYGNSSDLQTWNQRGELMTEMDLQGWCRDLKGRFLM